MKLGTELLECSVVILFVIIGDNNKVEPKLAYDGLPKEVSDLALNNVHQGLYLYLFGIIHSDNEKLLLTGCWEKWTE